MVESLIENVHREDLGLNEKGKFLKRIMALEDISSHHKLSKRIGISQKEISRAINFCELDSDIKVSAAQLPSSNIVEVTTRIEDKKTQKQILKKAVDGDWGRTRN